MHNCYYVQVGQIVFLISYSGMMVVKGTPDRYGKITLREIFMTYNWTRQAVLPTKRLITSERSKSDAPTLHQLVGGLTKQ